MSRCFPFPPPGYENKARPDDSNLIVKKHKQKKHEDKKEKDKKERSERKDKERTEGKHKVDKDCKEKKQHRDKKDKKKEKRKSSEDEKEIVGLSENQNGEKPSPYDEQGDGAGERRILVEMGKRVGNDGLVADKNGGKKEKWESSEEKKIAGPSENQDGEKPGPNNEPGDGAHGCKMLAQMGKRVRNDDEATDKKDKKRHKSSEAKNIVGPSGNQNGEKPGPDNEPGDGPCNGKMLAEMGRRVRNDNVAKDNSHTSMANGQSLRADAKCSGNNWVGNFPREKRIKVENGFRQANLVEKRMGSGEKYGDELENAKNRDKNEKEDKKRKKEEKKDKVREGSKEKTKRGARDGNLVDFCANNKPEGLLKESWDRQGKLMELKEPVLNGFLHDNGNRPDNMSRPVIHRVGQNGSGFHHPSQKNTVPLVMEKQAVIAKQTVSSTLPSPQSLSQNVRNSEPSHTANNSASEHLRTHINNIAISNGSISSQALVENGRKTARPNNADETVDGPRPVFVCATHDKDFGINSSLEGRKDISSRPSSASVKPPKEKAGFSMKKAPHPDLKYLSQILTVPKLNSPRFDDDDDDRDWLFGCKDAKKLESGPSETECTKRVWADAVRLESADVTALPYVIRY